MNETEIYLAELRFKSLQMAIDNFDHDSEDVNEALEIAQTIFEFLKGN